MSAAITLVEVGPRDGFQPIGPVIPTPVKIDYVRRLHSAGLRRMEATAFVSERAVPQLADAAAVLAVAQALPGLRAQALVPNDRYARRALDAGATHLAYVLSVSAAHNRNNVRRSPSESAEDYENMVAMLPDGISLRLNIATAFDCPFDGLVARDAVMALLDRLVPARPDVEVALCDTTGRAVPTEVHALFAAARARYPAPTTWAFHGHDTYGLGVANVLAAYQAGVGVFDASIAGLGGCPFAPGATGNVATEDVVWTFERMGIATGVDLARLLAIAADATAIRGGLAGGRVRTALAARACLPGAVA